MNVLFALALLVSPSQASVVMPVENGVAPAGPSATAVLIGAPAGGLIVAPSFGAGLDLRGGLPLLPSPAPGLAGPMLHFVGSAPQAAAVTPESGAAQVLPALATVRQGRAADKTPALPALPAKSSPGGPSLAISRDRKSAAVTPVTPERAAGLGRSFFDQSQDKGRGALAAAAERPSPVIGATIPDGGASGPGFGRAGRLAPPNAVTAFGTGHGPSRDALTATQEGETLHDSVASAPGTAVLPVFSAPRPLALDLSRSGLIVRVRSALSKVIAPAQSAASAAKLVVPGPSTALLERGAMFEAFSVAHAYADGTAAQSASAVQPLTAGSSRAVAPAVPPTPAIESSPAPLWWAGFVLPLLVAAIRGIL